MAYNLIACDRNQHYLLPPSIHDWLEVDHLARFLVDVVDEMDLSAFFARRREDGWGRATDFGRQVPGPPLFTPILC